MRAKLTYDGGLDDDVVAVAPVLLAAEDVTQALEDARGDDQFHVLAHIEVEHVGGRAAVGAVGTLVHDELWRERKSNTSQLSIALGVRNGSRQVRPRALLRTGKH